MSDTSPELVGGLGGRMYLVVNVPELSYRLFYGLLLPAILNGLGVSIQQVTFDCLRLGDMVASTHVTMLNKQVERSVYHSISGDRPTPTVAVVTLLFSIYYQSG